MGDTVFGELNGHAVGIILKEVVRRAISVARRERIAFEATTKESYAGSMDDVFTSADTKAQAIYLRAFGECFPGCGVIAEEDAFRIESKNGCYFTIDPVDGTKAYVRRQSHGISTMVSMVENGEVVAAFIGDINTSEIFGYRPGSDKVHRITDLDSAEQLSSAPPTDTDIAQRFALLRDPPRHYSAMSQSLITRFMNYEVMGSSIGTWAARLWKGEVSALFLPEGYETPWDSTPVIGISKKLGYGFYRPTRNGWLAFNPELPQVPTKRLHDVLITHPALFANVNRS